MGDELHSIPAPPILEVAAENSQEASGCQGGGVLCINLLRWDGWKSNNVVIPKKRRAGITDKGSNLMVMTCNWCADQPAIDTSLTSSTGRKAEEEAAEDLHTNQIMWKHSWSVNISIANKHQHAPAFWLPPKQEVKKPFTSFLKANNQLLLKAIGNEIETPNKANSLRLGFITCLILVLNCGRQNQSSPEVMGLQSQCRTLWWPSNI